MTILNLTLGDKVQMAIASEAKARLEAFGYETKLRPEIGVATQIDVCNDDKIIAVLLIKNGQVDDLQLGLLLSNAARRRIKKRRD